jgi:hypothetical protein
MSPKVENLVFELDGDIRTVGRREKSLMRIFDSFKYSELNTCYTLAQVSNVVLSFLLISALNENMREMIVNDGRNIFVDFSGRLQGEIADRYIESFESVQRHILVGKIDQRVVGSMHFLIELANYNVRVTALEVFIK